MPWLNWTDDASFFMRWSDFAPIPITQATQLGYSDEIYDGAELLRSDATVFLPPGPDSIAYFGSVMDSVGQPLIMDFDGIDFPHDFSLPFLMATSFPNTVIGVSSFYVNDNPVQPVRLQLAGATLFTLDNIGPLVAEACKAYPEACSR